MPLFKASEVAAPLTECAVKIDISMPDNSKILLIHRATDQDVTGL